MNSTLLTLATVVLAMISPATAQIIYTGHWDISAHEHLHDGDMELELVLHNHDLADERSLPQTVHFGFGNSEGTASATKQSVTIGNISLGNVWVSAADGNSANLLNLPFLGFSAEELGAGWTGSVTFTLSSLLYNGSGAGNLFLFEGEDVFWNSTQSGPNKGSFTVGVGQHGHGEFAFSDEGLYTLSLEVSGNYVATYTDNNSNNFFDSGDTILTTTSKSGTSTLDINVVPEPTCGTLLLTAFSVGMSLRRRFFRS
jgi:hypothetical protein